MVGAHPGPVLRVSERLGGLGQIPQPGSPASSGCCEKPAELSRQGRKFRQHRPQMLPLQAAGTYSAPSGLPSITQAQALPGALASTFPVFRRGAGGRTERRAAAFLPRASGAHGRGQRDLTWVSVPSLGPD